MALHSGTLEIPHYLQISFPQFIIMQSIDNSTFLEKVVYEPNISSWAYIPHLLHVYWS